ncbi:MAG: type II toxin-antitoxin system VapC family toxin [Actinomycetota bacterium]|nr:type II toxin-antitoxin system VapC family toxin [Actinomycetota bacterium]
MIVDASLVIDAVADPGPRGVAARAALAALPPPEPLSAPGHFAFEIMSGLAAAAKRPGHPLQPADLDAALHTAENLGIVIDATPWSDVRRAWSLAQGSLRYADAIYVAAAERHETALLTSDGRIERSGAAFACEVITVMPPEDTTGTGKLV